jgi:hypothetical protein
MPTPLKVGGHIIVFAFSLDETWMKGVSSEKPLRSALNSFKVKLRSFSISLEIIPLSSAL